MAIEHDNISAAPSESCEHRVIASTAADPNEEFIDKAARPKALSDYCGQDKIKEQLAIAIHAAKKRAEALDHVLIYGPPGLGKTTLAHIIANELGVNFKTTSGPALEKTGDLAAILTTLEAGDVLFIDEIHRLSPVIEEVLYPAMEDYQLDIVVGEGPGARSIKIDLKPFTLVGATTRAGHLTSPLRARFGINLKLDFYPTPVLTKIIQRYAAILHADIEQDAAEEIAKRSRGTPRIANRLLRRVRDYAEYCSVSPITRELSVRALNMQGIDNSGLDSHDQNYLRLIIDRFDGGPVGLDNIGATLGEDRDTIEDMIEPYLLQQGYIKRTPKGREAMPLAYSHFGLVAKDAEEHPSD